MLDALQDIEFLSSAVIDRIVRPDGKVLTDTDGTPCTITVYGPDSPQYKKVFASTFDKNMSKKSKRAKLEELEEDEIEILAACTIDWTGFTSGGKALPATRKNVISLYRQYTWLREQVDEFLQDRRNFTKTSKSSSSDSPSATFDVE